MFYHSQRANLLREDTNQMAERLWEASRIDR